MIMLFVPLVSFVPFVVKLFPNSKGAYLPNDLRSC